METLASGVPFRDTTPKSAKNSPSDKYVYVPLAYS